MGQKIVVGPIDNGLRDDVLPFNIDNDSFPVLRNAFQWRGRVKRKRGTSFLCRLTRYFNSLNPSYGSITTIILNGAGTGNIISGFDLEANANIVPGTVIITSSSTIVYTDPSENGNLSPSGIINYATGSITISSEANNTISVSFLYTPNLPVMGLEDFIRPTNAYPGNIAFDTVYSYNILNTTPTNSFDVSFYKNPNTSVSLPGYIRKTNYTPVTWNGQDYQQFWSVNYQGAFWATNGITVPFTTTNIGMQYAPSSTIVFVSETSTTLTVTITPSPLVVGDFVFLNEWTSTTPANANTLNFQTGYVTAASGGASNTVTITFPNASIATDTYTPGIIQYLTNRSDTTKDCLRFYDGDPTNGNQEPPTLNGFNGWVNFCPPLEQSQSGYIIADEPQAVYYLVGARMIVPFKDRLLFFGPVIQTSTAGSQVYLQDTVIYSQNGTAYYTASFQINPTVTSPQTIFNPILVPTQQTATAYSYFEDSTGFGGFESAGIDQPINTIGTNGDVLLIGFSTLQTRLVYSGNDLIPFNFYIINSELGSSSTFSSIIMDKGTITRGSRGFIITGQTSAERIDLTIPQEIFKVALSKNGAERVTSHRDFISEWIYETYPFASSPWRFPTQTLQYNHRDNSWGIFKESYTTYGSFRYQTGLTWATVGSVYPTWGQWNVPWGEGRSSLLQPQVIAGNQQGFVVIRDQGTTSESNSLYINNIAASIVTSPDHCLEDGDYIVISGVLGTVGQYVNGQIFSVTTAAQNMFVLNPTIPSGTYLGGGLIQKMYVPFIQTKQFPVAWNMARKTRLGPQMYLLSKTYNAQIQLLIYLSQDSDNAWNNTTIIPSTNVTNSSIIYSTVLYTCPESTNLGLTPFNTNLQMISEITSDGTNASSPQGQIWHRMNTSLIGDTVQLGFTLSDQQMRDPAFTSQFSEIELHGFNLDVSPSQLLS